MLSTGSTYGNIHRYESVRESTAAAIAIVLLTVIEVAFVFLFTYGSVLGWGLIDTGNMFLGGILVVVFADLALILALYCKELLPDVTIVKKRRRKWEDPYVREEDVNGVTAGNDDTRGQIKRAVYPYHKQ